MRKLLFISLFFTLTLTGCLEVIQAINQSGYALEFATSCEKGQKQKQFTPDQPVFIKMRTGNHKISRFTYRRRGVSLLNFKYRVGTMKEQSIQLEVPQEKLNHKGICLPLIPATVTIKDQKRLDLLKKLGEIHGDATLSVRLNYKIKGQMQFNFSGGNGRYGKLLTEIKAEIARIEAEKERKRREEAARRKKIIDDYYSAPDLAVYTIKNRCDVAGKIGIVTKSRLTNHQKEIPAKGIISIKARRGDHIVVDGKTLSGADPAKKEITICIKNPVFTALSTRYSGNDAWKSWSISTGKGNGSISTRYSGNDAWRSWSISLPGGISGSIATQYSGNDAWRSWRYSGKSNISISTQYSGKDGWKSWRVSGQKGSLDISTRYSGSDAWKSWRISGKGGSIELSTSYSGSDAWKSWRISDRLEADPELKMVALFVAAIYSGGVRQGGSSSGSQVNRSHCSFKGKRLYGKVKVVSSFPDIKVQVVNSFPDIKVQKVSSFPDRCGKWQFVDSFPDFTIQYVTSFPDIKVKFVSSFPGTN